jgi:hypothetical protein
MRIFYIQYKITIAMYILLTNKADIITAIIVIYIK